LEISLRRFYLQDEAKLITRDQQDIKGALMVSHPRSLWGWQWWKSGPESLSLLVTYKQNVLKRRIPLFRPSVSSPICADKNAFLTFIVPEQNRIAYVNQDQASAGALLRVAFVPLPILHSPLPPHCEFGM
jgi:hypothetical protein